MGYDPLVGLLTEKIVCGFNWFQLAHLRVQWQLLINVNEFSGSTCCEAFGDHLSKFLLLKREFVS